MRKESYVGITDELPEQSQFVGGIIGLGSQFLMTGNCAIWDKNCQEREAASIAARQEEARAAQALAETNKQKDQQQMYLMAGGGILVVLVFFMLMFKK